MLCLCGGGVTVFSRRLKVLFGDLVQQMEEKGYSLTDLEPGFRDLKTG